MNAEFLTRNDQKFFTGYAALWDDETDETSYYIGEIEGTPIFERFAKDCFDLSTPVECWFNHDSNLRLGTTAGNLQLRSDDKGLFYELPYDHNNSNHVFVKSQFDQKLIHGSSIGFRIRSNPSWKREKVGDSYLVTEADLRDVGPVYLPAYKSASAQFRSEMKTRSASEIPQDILMSWKTWKRFQKI